MNCFNTNKVFPSVHFHEYHEVFQQNTVFPSVSSNFLEFRMFWHVPFQELQVSKRNRHFEQNFQHLFPVPFFASLWVSLADCASASLKAVSLAPRMRPSLGCLAASKQHPNNIQTQKKHPHCEVKLLPCCVSKQRVQLLLWKSWYFYHRNMSSG